MDIPTDTPPTTNSNVPKSGDPKIPTITILEEGEEGSIKVGLLGSTRVKKVDGKWKIRSYFNWNDPTEEELKKINKKYK